MIEALRQILREGGSVRRAEELARRMKAKSNQGPKPKARVDEIHVVSEEIDKIKDDLQSALGKGSDGSTQVKLVRSRRETRVTFILKGTLVETEARLQKIHKSLTS